MHRCIIIHHSREVYRVQEKFFHTEKGAEHLSRSSHEYGPGGLSQKGSWASQSGSPWPGGSTSMFTPHP